MLAITPQQHPHPSGQFAEGKRLDQIVVGARIQSLDALINSVPGGEHKDPRRPRLRRVCPNLRAHLEPIDVRHREIEADQVIRLELQPFQRIVTTMDDIDGVTVAAKAGCNSLREINLIVDNKNSHCIRTYRIGYPMWTRPTAYQVEAKASDFLVPVP